MNSALAFRPEPGFNCRWLNYVDILDCDELQKNVVDKLTAEDLRLYFYPRSSMFRDQVLLNKNHIIGCFNDDQLVGQALFLKNNNDDDLKKNFMLDIEVPDIISNGHSGVITNAMVDPDYRGRNIMLSTLMYLNGQLSKINVDTSYFITHITNHAMIMSGLRAGFQITNVGTCWNNNEPMFLMAYTRSKNILKAQDTEFARISGGDIKEAQRYFQQGFVAAEYSPADGLLLQRSKAA